MTPAETLTEKELRIVSLVAEGRTNADIGKVLNTTRLVIANHLRPVYEKLGFSNRVEVALWYEQRRAEGKI